MILPQFLGFGLSQLFMLVYICVNVKTKYTISYNIIQYPFDMEHNRQLHNWLLWGVPTSWILRILNTNRVVYLSIINQQTKKCCGTSVELNYVR
jgi:hypothetical protein